MSHSNFRRRDFLAFRTKTSCRKRTKAWRLPRRFCRTTSSTPSAVHAKLSQSPRKRSGLRSFSGLSHWSGVRVCGYHLISRLSAVHSSSISLFCTFWESRCWSHLASEFVTTAFTNGQRASADGELHHRASDPAHQRWRGRGCGTSSCVVLSTEQWLRHHSRCCRL